MPVCDVDDLFIFTCLNSSQCPLSPTTNCPLDSVTCVRKVLSRIAAFNSTCLCVCGLKLLGRAALIY